MNQTNNESFHPSQQLSKSFSSAAATAVLEQIGVRTPVKRRRFKQKADPKVTSLRLPSKLKRAEPAKYPSKKSYHYEKDYVEKNLIAYIGNKRRLLPLIIKALQTVEQDGGTPIDRSGLFIDYFSGTGVVARAAKSLGFTVIANDWEPYAYRLGKAFIETSNETLDVFADEGGLEAVLIKLNALTRYDKKHAYFSKYYCPRSTKQADPEHERLFYTRENGILIDNIRYAIDTYYPAQTTDPILKQKRTMLLALLLVQGSRRSNTSGIFKAYHYGFGGRKQDALNRIMAPIALQMPTLSASNRRGRVFKSHAIRLAQKLRRLKHSAEIVYLDPPYNQHQYGSNYHILNTIALGDRPQVNKHFWIDGKKVDKSAIRKDWKETRSSFCYRQTALVDFKKLIHAIHAKYIFVSYSTEGIIDFKSMLKVLAQKGKLSVATHNYVRFRGGRQTNVTKKLNVEFILIVETGACSTADDIVAVEAKLGQANCVNCFNDFFPIQKPSEDYKVIEREFGYELAFGKENESLFLDKKLHLCTESNTCTNTEFLGIMAPAILKHLEQVMPKTNEERIYWIANLIIRGYNVDTTYFLGELLRLYKKLMGDVNQPEALCRSRETIKQALYSVSHQKNITPARKESREKKWVSARTLLQHFPTLHKKAHELSLVLETVT